MRLSKKYKIGQRLRVEWIDYVGHVNEPLNNVKPASCWTEGTLVKWEPDYFVLASSQYIDEEPDPSKVGDYTVIITGGVKSIKQL